MRIIKIPNEFKNSKYTFEWFYNVIKSQKSSIYLINKEILNEILLIENLENLKLVLYIIYKILIQNSLTPNISPTPSNGIEFKNPNSNEYLGIYHAHLNDGYVLIWYLIYNEYGYCLNFDYIKHPPANDNYKTIIKDIYGRNDDGFNLEYDEYFINLFNILNFDIKEIKILKFKEYLFKLLK